MALRFQKGLVGRQRDQLPRRGLLEAAFDARDVLVDLGTAAARLDHLVLHRLQRGINLLPQRTRDSTEPAAARPAAHCHQLIDGEREAGVQLAPPLYSDALSAPGSAGDTYVNMIRYNVTTIVNALK